ncbi:permease prefix domain 1-containing protein [Streptomyces sp. NPDC002104]
MTEAAVLRRYAEHLAEHLVGPSSRRSEILDEVLDGLECATEDNLDLCTDAEEAARRAVREWGTPTEVARAYNDATLRISANRLSARAVCALPLLAATWASAMLGGPAGPWQDRHPPLLLLGLSVVVFGCVLSLAGAVSGLRKGSGIEAADARRDRGVTTGTLAALIGLLCVLGALILLVLNRGLSHPESLDWPMVSVAAAMTLLAGGYFAPALKGFLAVMRGAGPA